MGFVIACLGMARLSRFTKQINTNSTLYIYIYIYADALLKSCFFVLFLRSYHEYLTDRVTGFQGFSIPQEAVEDKIMQTNPVLESFGNAMTARSLVATVSCLLRTVCP